jgi:hypothetical protein
LIEDFVKRELFIEAGLEMMGGKQRPSANEPPRDVTALKRKVPRRVRGIIERLETAYKWKRNGERRIARSASGEDAPSQSGESWQYIVRGNRRPNCGIIGQDTVILRLPRMRRMTSDRFDCR